MELFLGGFYYINIEKQARRWALARLKTHVVSVYEYNDNPTLNMF